MSIVDECVDFAKIQLKVVKERRDKEYTRLALSPDEKVLEKITVLGLEIISAKNSLDNENESENCYKRVEYICENKHWRVWLMHVSGETPNRQWLEVFNIEEKATKISLDEVVELWHEKLNIVTYNNFLLLLSSSYDSYSSIKFSKYEKLVSLLIDKGYEIKDKVFNPNVAMNTGI